MYFAKTCPLDWLIPFFAWIVATNALSQNDPSAPPENSATPNKKAEVHKTLTYSNAVIGYCNRLADPVFGLTGLINKLEFTDRQEVLSLAYREDQSGGARTYLIPETESERFRITRCVIITEFRLIVVLEKLDRAGISAEDPQSPSICCQVTNGNAGVIF